MPSPMRILTLAILVSGIVLATARFSGEKGARPHRTRLAAGQYHTCAILDDGTVQCWGRNNFGQLGDGTVTTRLTPVPVSSLGTTISITAGAFHTCALSSSGTVSCWGLNDNGRLGHGTAASSALPVSVPLTNVVSIAAGGAHTCAVRVDGSVWCWGAAIANGSLSSSLGPNKVDLRGGAAESVAAGGSHTCALMGDTTVKCWGLNSYGQSAYYGSGGNADHASPVPVVGSPQFAPLSAFVDVSAGGNFTCGLKDTVMYCWGDATDGQAGRLSGTGGPFPDEPFIFDGAVALATGGAHTCALYVTSVQCFGLNDAGQLGTGSTTAVGTIEVFGVANAIEIAAGAKHTCVIIVGGAIRCWGDNTYGQHGDGIAGPAGTDSVLSIGGTFLARGVAAGNQFPCGRRGTGALACWGIGGQGQLGDSSNASSVNPVAVTGIPNALAVTTGGAHACALVASGAAACWGDNSRGQLGNGTTTGSNQPVAVRQGALQFVAISAGGSHTCAIEVSGSVYCWGAGDGSGTFVDSAVPIAVPIPTTGGTAKAIAAGNGFTCALSTAATVSCWGDNSSGQLAVGGTQFLFDVVGIAAGASHACAARVTGQVECWGANSRGQLGNNSTSPAALPVAVQAMTDAVAVSAGAFFTCAAQAGGGASCWGANDSGELAAIDQVDHLTPTAVGTSRICLACVGGRAFVPLTGVAAIATGTTTLSSQEHACALLASGVVECWGNNASGQIGDGTTISEPRPTVVNSFAANVDAAAVLRNSHTTEATALIDCESGGHAQIILTLAQGAVTGTGRAEAQCQGRLLRVPLLIPAQGSTGFAPGPAVAHVQAVVRDNDTVVEDTHWTRQVTLSIANRD